MDIVRLHGTDPELYRLVAPLVMDYRIIKQNLGFPFRTSERHTWWVATVRTDEGEDKVVGFVPVDRKPGGPIINNYYIAGGNQEVLSALLSEVNKDEEFAERLSAMALTRDEATFRKAGFMTVNTLTRYLKMVRQLTKNK